MYILILASTHEMPRHLDPCAGTKTIQQELEALPEYQETLAKVETAKKALEALSEYQEHQVAKQKLKEKKAAIEEATQRAIATPEHKDFLRLEQQLKIARMALSTTSACQNRETPEYNHFLRVEQQLQNAQRALEATEAYQKWQELKKPASQDILLRIEELPEERAEKLAANKLQNNPQWKELQEWRRKLTLIQISFKAKNKPAESASSSK